MKPITATMEEEIWGRGNLFEREAQSAGQRRGLSRAQAEEDAVLRSDVITPQEFAERMRELKDNCNGDPEALYGRADALLCEVLRSLGYGEGIDTFEALEIWYA